MKFKNSMSQYLDLGQRILDEGILTENRTNQKAMSVTGATLVFDMDDGFPVPTEKKFFHLKAFAEQLWFMQGKQDRTSLVRLQAPERDPSNESVYASTIWDIDMSDGGLRNSSRFSGCNLGNMYPSMWRNLPITKKQTCREPFRSLYPTSRKLDYGLTPEEFLVYKSHFKSECFDVEHVNTLSTILWSRFHSLFYVPDDAPDNLVTWKNSFELFSMDLYTLPGFQELTDMLEGSILYIDICSRVELTGKYSVDYSPNVLTRDTTRLHLPSIPPITYIDPLQDVIDLIKTDPTSRRMVINNWNPRVLDNAVLAICHSQLQFIVEGDRLNLCYYQRSCDYLLGVPFNIANYALMLHIIANITGYKPGKLVANLGDIHIYENAIDATKEMLSRTSFPLPRLSMPDIKSLDDLYNYKASDFKLVGYAHHPAILVEMAH